MEQPIATPQTALFGRLRIKSRQIMLLDALDEHRNLRRAAAAIHTTQPAATALLQQLEQGLGVALFTRHARGMEPTVYGEVMIRYARGMLHDFDHARDEIGALAAGSAGLVRIGSVMGAVPAILTPGLGRFKRENPRVQVTVHVDTSDLLVPALLRGDLDLVLGRLPDQFYDADLEVAHLKDEPMAVVARPGHPLAARKRLNIAGLAGQTWVLHPTGSPMRRRIEQALQESGLSSPPDIMDTASILATTALLESTDMISVVPLDVAKHYAKYGMLAILPVAMPMSMAKLGIVTRKEKEMSPAVRMFVRTLNASLSRRRAATA